MPLIIGATAATATASLIPNSCRWNPSDTPKLERTFGAGGDIKTYTISVWFKRCGIGANQVILQAYGASDSYVAGLKLTSGDQLQFDVWDNGDTCTLKTDRVLRDVSAWYHCVIAFDSTNTSAKMWINGVLQTSWASETQPSLNADGLFNTSGFYYVIGMHRGGGSQFDGYIADPILIDATAYDNTDFGEFDTDSPGIWKPIDVSGLTFGTQGAFLNFADSADLVNDVSGNGNDLTNTNLVAADQSQDSPVNNFCTLNSENLPTSNAPAFTQGNTYVVTPNAGSAYFGGTTTIGLSSGKWYWETYCVSALAAAVVGVYTDPNDAALNNRQPGYSTYDWAYEYDGTIISGNVDQDTGMGSWTSGDYIGTYLDLDNLKIYWAKDGVIINSGTGWTITAASLIAPYSSPGAYFPGCADQETTSSTFAYNFGNGAFGDTVLTGTTYADADGYGIFKYSPNDGGSASFDSSAKDFMAICTKNLAAYGG